MNLYYQTMVRNVWNCDFKGSGLIAITDPSKSLPSLVIENDKRAKLKGYDVNVVKA